MVDAKSKVKVIATAKEYRDSVVAQINTSSEGTVFTSADEALVAARVDDGPADFIIEPKNFAPDAKANPVIEKFESGKRHSFEYGTEPSSEVTGQTSTGLPKVATNDPVADKNKRVY